MKHRQILLMSIWLTVLGTLYSPNAQAYRAYHYWWRPHLIRENTPTDAFRGRIESSSGSTITVRGREIIRHSLRWSYGYNQSPLPSYHRRYHRRGKTAQEQTFVIPASCHITTASGNSALRSDLQIGRTVTVGYAVQATGGRVAVDITIKRPS